MKKVIVSLAAIAIMTLGSASAQAADQYQLQDSFDTGFGVSEYVSFDQVVASYDRLLTNPEINHTHSWVASSFDKAFGISTGHRSSNMLAYQGWKSYVSPVELRG